MDEAKKAEAVERLLRQRVEQGLPPKISDPVVLARIAAIGTGDRPKEDSDGTT